MKYSISNLSVRYRGDKRRSVLNNVNIELESGRIVGIIGESGCGKTTFARALTGILPESASIISGALSNENKTFTFSRSHKIKEIRVAMLLQDSFAILNPSLSIKRQFYLCSASKKDYLTEAKKLLIRVGINDTDTVLGKYPSELSGGMNQRIGVALSLAAKPDIMIFDEPTSAVDADNEILILELIKQLTTQYNIATCVISHNIASVESIADEIVVMKDGAVLDSIDKTNGTEWTYSHPYSKLLRNCCDNRYMFSKDDIGELLFSAKGLKKVIGNQLIFEDLSLQLYDRETLGIIGRSGCGKSTLARIICGYSDYDQGEINQSPNTKIEMVFQNAFASLDPKMQIRRILNEARHILKMPLLADEQLMYYIEGLPLPQDILSRTPQELSGGQRQLIAIIRALAVEPTVIVLDEPTSALDMVTQHTLISILEAMKHKYLLTYIIISHDRKLIESIADRTISL